MVPSSVTNASIRCKVIKNESFLPQKRSEGVAASYTTLAVHDVLMQVRTRGQKVSLERYGAVT